MWRPQGGRIRKYETPEEIIAEFYELRLVLYQKRKAHLTDQLTEQWTKLDNRVRFIKAVISGELVVANRKKADLLNELQAKGYTPYNRTPASAADADAAGVDEAANDDTTAATASSAYDYLLSMPLWSLTHEKVAELMEERNAKERELNELLATSPQQLWINDLDTLLRELDAYEANQAAATSGASKAKSHANKSGKGVAARPTKKVAAPSAESDTDGIDSADEDGADGVDDEGAGDDWKPTVAGNKKTAKKKATAASGAAAKMMGGAAYAPVPIHYKPDSAPQKTVKAAAGRAAAANAADSTSGGVSADSATEPGEAPLMAVKSKSKAAESARAPSSSAEPGLDGDNDDDAFADIPSSSLADRVALRMTSASTAVGSTTAAASKHNVPGAGAKKARRGRRRQVVMIARCAVRPRLTPAGVHGQVHPASPTLGAAMKAKKPRRNKADAAVADPTEVAEIAGELSALRVTTAPTATTATADTKSGKNKQAAAKATRASKPATGGRAVRGAPGASARSKNKKRVDDDSDDDVHDFVVSDGEGDGLIGGATDAAVVAELPIERPRRQARAAAQRVKYCFDSGEDDEEEECNGKADDELHDDDDGDSYDGDAASDDDDDEDF